jgi:undecaprenyl-diphosphatase
VGSAAAAAFAGIVLFQTLKKKSRRRRPCDIEPHCWSQVLPPDKYSFPSGHSITAFAIAISIGVFYPQLQPCLLAVAVTIAFSRIVLGMHFLSDVVVGSLIGVILALVSVHFFLML